MAMSRGAAVRPLLIVWLSTFLQLLMFCGSAQAGPLSCSIASASGINLTYVPSATAPLVGSGTVTINCIKTGTNSDTRYLELAADQGLYSSGGSNRAANGPARLNYALWRDAATSSAWRDTNFSRITATVTSTTSTSLTLNWWISVSPQQAAVAGTFADTVNIRLYQGSSSNPALSDLNPSLATVSLALTVASQCALSSNPGAVQFNYTSFQRTPSSAGTSFAVTCTNGARYTMSLDKNSGTLLGLNYELQLSASGIQTGTGLPQAVSILGTMAEGQAGICAVGSCSSSEPRILTISY